MAFASGLTSGTPMAFTADSRLHQQLKTGPDPTAPSLTSNIKRTDREAVFALKGDPQAIPASPCRENEVHLLSMGSN
ncbi:hypothetical protein LTR17_015493 [Elasticomyces elasticus]|nr:hypothetical protein LTR17_015493 [Elasticomyces elasticus]